MLVPHVYRTKIGKKQKMINKVQQNLCFCWTFPIPNHFTSPVCQALNQLFEKIMALDIDERHLLRLGHGEEELETEKDFSR